MDKCNCSCCRIWEKYNEELKNENADLKRLMQNQNDRLHSFDCQAVADGSRIHELEALLASIEKPLKGHACACTCGKKIFEALQIIEKARKG